MSVRRIAVWSAVIVGTVGLEIFFSLARDLFYAIPWSVRKAPVGVIWFGIACACAHRLWTVRPGDDLPLDDKAGDPTRSDRWLPWVLAALIAVLGWPLLSDPDGLPFGDWDYYAAKYEACRRSIVDYQQFPWWDPWTRGGFPLAANPLCGVSGVAMPLVLAFGTTIGLRLATLACFLLAAEGARRLARIWLGDPVASAAAGLIYAINGGVIVASVAAYDIPMGTPSFPGCFTTSSGSISVPRPGSGWVSGGRSTSSTALPTSRSMWS
jgi:hypothetical protein